MLNKDTIRIGGIKSEMDAARIYDFIAILTQGLSVSIKYVILFIIYLIKYSIDRNNCFLSIYWLLPKLSTD